MAWDKRSAYREFSSASGHSWIKKKIQNKRAARGLDRFASVGEYKKIYLPKHPEASSTGHVWEHRLVAEYHLQHRFAYYGYNHADNDIVHHIDMDRGNNEPSNLRIMKRSEHTAYHNKYQLQQYKIRV
jgi:hypothetical protein